MYKIHGSFNSASCSGRGDCQRRAGAGYRGECPRLARFPRSVLLARRGRGLFPGRIAFSGDATRFPDIRFIWSHAGGSAPFLAGRIDGASGNARDALPNGFIAAAKRFHYDTAGAANRGALTSLLQLVAPSQIVFGTDFPPGGTSASVAKALADTGLFSANDLQSIGRDNAVRLLPRLDPAGASRNL